MAKERRRVLILGAAGRDFHNFNVAFRHRVEVAVVGFTATQIPGIGDRTYPAELAGPHYPAGIPIFDESGLESLIASLRVDEAVFSYSDVSHSALMHVASRVLAAGADFSLLGPASTMITSRRPVISVCAVRTGCGKSQTARFVAKQLVAAGRRVAVVRHPMPYGDLAAQRVQRFDSMADMARHRCTVEEYEEYEPYVALGIPIFAGVDYQAILDVAERDSEIILWDGGNNDLPFYRADLEICVADPHRLGHETGYHPGETNARRAAVLVVNKVDSAPDGTVETLCTSLRQINPKATIVLAESRVTADDPAGIAGKRVLCVEDGPTLTHGEMAFGAGAIAAQRFGAAEVVDPRSAAVGCIADAYENYPTLGHALPALGYGANQLADLQETIARADCDLVLVATPIDLAQQIRIDKPHQRVRYEYADHGEPTLASLLDRFLDHN